MMVATIGGLACGFVAGAAAQYGRLCTMGAIEDATMARDHRSAKLWMLALAITIAFTQTSAALGLLDIKASIHASARLDWVAALAGGVLFGLGMSLAGACSFGMLVRAGSGDLRALVTSALIGITAFAFTAGTLEPVRIALTGHATLDMADAGGALLTGLAAAVAGRSAASILCGVAVLLLVLPALADRRLRRQPKRLIASILIGSAIAGGWLVTAEAERMLEPVRIESLSFVAPVGRLILDLMGQPAPFASFGVASVVGVVAGALCASALKDELRWEAFDDAREMRRHLGGAFLMGVGGVLAKGCTIGQGLSAASATAMTAPIVILGVVLGAKVGLTVLIEGRAPWQRMPPP